MAKITCTQSEYELISQALATIHNTVPIVYDFVEVSTNYPKDYRYDTETEEFYVYRHKYNGNEIHIPKDPTTYLITHDNTNS